MSISFYTKVTSIDSHWRNKRVRVCADMSPSIGTPPRLIQPPSVHDARLLLPSLTPKWDPLTLSETNSFICNDQLNFNEIFPSVGSTTFGTNSIRNTNSFQFDLRKTLPFLESTPSVSHPAMTRPYSSTSSISQNLTVSFHFTPFFLSQVPFSILEQFRTDPTGRLSIEPTLRSRKYWDCLCMSLTLWCRFRMRCRQLWSH